MMAKKNERGLCPYNKMKPCNPKCVLYRSGFRYTEGQDPIPFEDCAINITCDNMEAMHNRTYTLQKEIGEQKNMLAYKLMSELGYMGEAEAMNKIAGKVEEGQVLLENKEE